MNKYAFLLLLCLTACGTSPKADYYSLRAVSGATHATQPMTVKIRRPGLAATLDRPEMVSVSGHNVAYDEYRLWSEPLDKMIERVTAENLGARLPNAAVITESGGMVAEPDVLVDLEIQEFGTKENGRPVLAAVLAVHRGDVALAPRRIELYGNGSGPQGLSDLLAQMADRIAADLSR